MGEKRRGVVLYGSGADVVAAALRELDPIYGSVDGMPLSPGQVPVLYRPSGSDADAVRAAEPGVTWLVVELFRAGVDVKRAQDPLLFLNMSKVGPRDAARAIDQPDLTIWYEVINPVQVLTDDGGPVAPDYSNLKLVEPAGHRKVAHAVGADGVRPACLPGDAAMVLPSHDLWALGAQGETEMCRECIVRHA